MLQDLIDKLTLDYVNPDITETNFPPQPISNACELFTIRNLMTTQEIKKVMDANGLRPANIYELVTWAEKNWNKNDWIVAFGSAWVDSTGDRVVPMLGQGGSDRDLNLRWGGPSREWDGSCRFLAVSKFSDTGAFVAKESVLGRLALIEAEIAKLERIINL